MWLEDISCSPEKIAQKLITRGVVNDIKGHTVRNMFLNVNFISIRKRLSQQYQQGKYRKRERWIFSRYQQIIDDLLKRLSDGEK